MDNPGMSGVPPTTSHPSSARPVLIAGGGIGGMATALTLHQIGVPCVVFESVPELQPLGVGINLQPNAVRELHDLGFGNDVLDTIGLQAREWALVGRNGNEVYAEPRGLEAGYHWPQYSVHRGQLQMMLFNAVRERLGDDAARRRQGDVPAVAQHHRAPELELLPGRGDVRDLLAREPQVDRALVPQEDLDRGLGLGRVGRLHDDEVREGPHEGDVLEPHLRVAVLADADAGVRADQLHVGAVVRDGDADLLEAAGEEASQRSVVHVQSRELDADVKVHQLVEPHRSHTRLRVGGAVGFVKGALQRSERNLGSRFAKQLDETVEPVAGGAVEGAAVVEENGLNAAAGCQVSGSPIILPRAPQVVTKAAAGWRPR